MARGVALGCSSWGLRREGREREEGEPGDVLLLWRLGGLRRIPLSFLDEL